MTHLLTAAGVISAAVVTAVAVSNGSSALLSSSATLSASPAPTLHAGTLAVSINAQSPSVAVALSGAQLLPATTYAQDVSVRNAGNVAGDLSAVLQGGAATGWTVTIAGGTCQHPGYTTGAGSNGTTLSSKPVPLARAVTSGMTVGVCVSVSTSPDLAATANSDGSVTGSTPPSDSVAFTIEQTS